MRPRRIHLFFLFYSCFTHRYTNYLVSVKEKSRTQLKKFHKCIEDYKAIMNGLFSMENTIKLELENKEIDIENPNLNLERLFEVKSKKRSKRRKTTSLSKESKVEGHNELKIESKGDTHSKSDPIYDSNNKIENKFITDNKTAIFPKDEFAPQDLIYQFPREGLFPQSDLEDFQWMSKEELSQHFDLLEEDYMNPEQLAEISL